MNELRLNKNVRHVEPRNDLHPHFPNGLPCPWKPRTVLTEDSIGFVIVHEELSEALPGFAEAMAWPGG